MQNLIQTTKETLQNYDYLHLYALTELVKSKGVFESDVINHEDFLNNLILEDIKANKTSSTFIKVGLEQYALRKESDLENLYSFLKCRLSTFIFWEINHHDINYSNELFGKDIFSENDTLLNMLETLKNNGKINSFTPISNKQVIVLF
ncbi:MAG: hypothetical protein PHI37_04995 [Candidatus Gracilibacteria bacterium]|nr:hypothetical protein [Candidatus Gracilibacteria bacterium]